MKATWVSCNGESIAIYKDPKTDNGTKKSAKGILRVIKEGDEYTLLQEQDSFGADETIVYYIDGCIQETESFAEVKKRAMINI